MKVEDRVSPHSIEAERALLGAVLVSPEIWSAAAAVVAPDDFYRAGHRAIFAAMGGLAARGVAIDLVTLTDALGTDVDLAGGRVYLSSLVDGVPRSSNAAHYAGLVRERARLRRLIQIADGLMTDALAGETSAARLADHASSALADAAGASGRQAVSARDAVTGYVEALSRGTIGAPLATGFADLDGVVGGLKPGDLVIVAARPSVGKSSLALAIARHLAANDSPSVFFSLEMTADGIASRLLAWASGVSSVRLERQTATADEYVRVGEAAALMDLPLTIESSATTVMEMSAWCRRAQREGRLACAVVDYLQLLVPDRHRESDEAEIAGISKSLKRMAKELGVVVIAVSQLSRAPEGRKDKRPHTSDLRGSGTLEQDCDLALLLFREEMYTPKPENRGVAEVIVAKNRSGPTGVVRLAWVAELAMFGNLAQQGGV